MYYVLVVCDIRILILIRYRYDISTITRNRYDIDILGLRNILSVLLESLDLVRTM